MTSITIGIDARELIGTRTGVGRYLGELMCRWTRRADKNQRGFLLYTPEPLVVSFPNTTVRVVPGGRGTRWEQTSLSKAIRADEPDVFFAPAYTAPLRLQVPFAVTIHDVSFSRHPEWFRPRERYRRHLLTRSAARRAAAVITVSEFSKREIADVYGIAAERIQTIYNGFTARPQPANVPRERIVLFAGSVFNRRRLPDLVAAFAVASRAVPDAHLVIAGANRSWPFEDLVTVAHAHGVSDRVTLTDYMPDNELDALYSRASVFAFLSEYEGFGLTPLEALAARLPVVVLDTEVAHEIYGEAVSYVGRGDVSGTAETLVRLMTSPQASEQLRGQAPGVLARYSWDTAAERTLAVLERIVRR